ncbi:unnamed protein product, partial [Ascophyllum nodosum]
MVAGASSQESREERKDAVMITACNKSSQATGPRTGKGKQRKHTNVGVDIQSYMHHKLPNN